MYFLFVSAKYLHRALCSIWVELYLITVKLDLNTFMVLLVGANCTTTWNTVHDVLLMYQKKKPKPAHPPSSLILSLTLALTPPALDVKLYNPPNLRCFLYTAIIVFNRKGQSNAKEDSLMWHHWILFTYVYFLYESFTSHARKLARLRWAAGQTQAFTQFQTDFKTDVKPYCSHHHQYCYYCYYYHYQQQQQQRYKVNKEHEAFMVHTTGDKFFPAANNACNSVSYIYISFLTVNYSQSTGYSKISRRCDWKCEWLFVSVSALW